MPGTIERDRPMPPSVAYARGRRRERAKGPTSGPDERCVGKTVRRPRRCSGIDRSDRRRGLNGRESGEPATALNSALVQRGGGVPLPRTVRGPSDGAGNKLAAGATPQAGLAAALHFPEEQVKRGGASAKTIGPVQVHLFNEFVVTRKPRVVDELRFVKRSQEVDVDDRQAPRPPAVAQYPAGSLHSHAGAS